jgi:hypothetical protein
MIIVLLIAIIFITMYKRGLLRGAAAGIPGGATRQRGRNGAQRVPSDVTNRSDINLWDFDAGKVVVVVIVAAAAGSYFLPSAPLKLHSIRGKRGSRRSFSTSEGDYNF